ncbi:TetR/AcrR family transcriptional regulator [Pseudomonas panipatensis]|jgi:AcrR family transcriptional regulator|uniref:Transcriptional regulator, TetR family n=1 Tax=Pseudomonas panipatensis TaxID=428992 RepID=A0A1G8C8I9_9PSED|nr:TetR/AcrR family transcriptional regulator [Pseudomonas panipatensis]SDH41633.1 transcriptional regulator, TetR family [Pseudomonas panipatensis]SMP66018.1 transcriptional regulator, TetR family [Pseudomonas panipatensis]
MSDKSTAGDKKTQTRERILQAAAAALVRRGPLEPSVNEVMSAAGLTVGGFYAHFDSKDALMLEAFRQTLASRRAALKSFDAATPFSERRALAAAFYLSRKHRDSEGQGCPLPSSLAEAAQLPEGFREALAEHIELMVAALAERPEDADLVLADLALMVGGLSLARALGQGDLSDRILRAAKKAVI